MTTPPPWTTPEGMVWLKEPGPVEETRSILSIAPLELSEPSLGRVVGRLPYPLLIPIYRPCDEKGDWTS